MRPIEGMLVRSVLLLILCGIDFGFLLGGYGILRVLRISVNWVTWIIASFIIALSVEVSLAIIMPGTAPSWLDRGGGNLVGVFSFLIAVFAASQSMTRQWSVHIKRQTRTCLVRASMDLL